MNTQTQSKIATRSAKIKDITEEHFELIEPLNDMVDILQNEYGEDEFDMEDVYNIFINVIEEMGLNDENTIEDINRIYHEKETIIVI